MRINNYLFLKKRLTFPRFLVLLLIVFFCRETACWAQATIDTDIYLVDLSLTAGTVSKPQNITHRKGYDNQPSFTPDGKRILYTSLLSDGQTDIFQYDLTTKATTQVTHTPESEYSPTVMPNQSHFSTVRVEADKTQRLWWFTLPANSAPTLILPHVKPVGYHCWLDADQVALFVLGQPNSLQLAQVSTGDTTRLDERIGRTLLKVPGKHALSYIHKIDPTHWEIRQIDLKTRQITPITQTLEGSEDFVWSPTGSLLMGKGPILYQFTPGTSTGWTPLADFTTSGIMQITRLAIDATGKRLAIVGQP